MEINTESSAHALNERYAELKEVENAPYLSETRKEAISIELGRLSFELRARGLLHE